VDNLDYDIKEVFLKIRFILMLSLFLKINSMIIKKKFYLCAMKFIRLCKGLKNKKSINMNWN